MSFRPLFGLVALLFGLASPPRAQEADAPDLAMRIGRYYIAYTINPDGSFTEDREWSMTVLQERAVDGARQTSIGYSTSMQDAEIKAAYTLKPDGRRIDAPPSNFQIKTNRGKDEHAPVFSDRTSMSVVFPEVGVGDTVVFAYRLTAKAPMFPGHFSTEESFWRTSAFDDVRITIDAPAALWTQHQARGLQEVRNVEKDGRRVLEWRFENEQPIKSKREDYSVVDPEGEPGFAYSTFRNYGEIAEAYAKGARPKLVVSERVRKLADEIVKDQTAPFEVARSLYEWVATHLSFAGNCVGLGAVVPHDIDFVLDNRMGDCKDHATLLQALLAAKGIASTQALINSGSTYHLAKIPVASSVNHVINYLPSLDLYADATSGRTPFGMLPDADAGKQVLLIDGYQDGVRTPVLGVERNRQHMRTTIRVLPDGSVQGEAEVVLKGAYAVHARAAFRDMSRDHEADLLKNYFRGQGFIGSGTMGRDDAKPLLDHYTYRATFEVKDMLRLHGPGAFHVMPVLFSQHAVAGYLGIAIDDTDLDHEVACSSGSSVEEYRYEFPKRVKLLATPDDFELSNDFLSYRAHYKLKGRTLTVKREMHDRTPGNVCSPDLMRAYKEFARQAMQDVKSQVVYKGAK